MNKDDLFLDWYENGAPYPLGVIVCAKCNGDHLGGYDEPNSTFDTWCFDCEAPTTKKEVN